MKENHIFSCLFVWSSSKTPALKPRVSIQKLGRSCKTQNHLLKRSSLVFLLESLSNDGLTKTPGCADRAVLQIANRKSVVI